MNDNYTKKNTIIWAEDDPDDVYLIRQVLDEVEHDFNVLVVSNGREVIEYLSAKDPQDFPCLIILDINMPVLDGKQTLAYLKKHAEYKSISVVMFTTSNSATDKLFCKHYEAELVTKPSNFQALRESVATLLKNCVPVER